MRPRDFGHAPPPATFFEVPLRRMASLTRIGDVGYWVPPSIFCDGKTAIGAGPTVEQTATRFGQSQSSFRDAD